MPTENAPEKTNNTPDYPHLVYINKAIDPRIQKKARDIIADLLSSSILQNAPEFVFCKDNENPILQLQDDLRSMETSLQESPETLAFMIEFTKIYNRALKGDTNRKTDDVKKLREDLTNLSNYLSLVKKEVKNQKSVQVPEEYEIIIDAMRNNAAVGRLGPFSNVVQQMRNWAKHTKEDIKDGIGIGKTGVEKFIRMTVASGMIGLVGAGTIMMYANYQPPTTSKIPAIMTGYQNISFDENGQMDFNVQYDQDKVVEGLKLNCHSHIEGAVFGYKPAADYLVENIFTDEESYQDCITIGESAQGFYERFDMPAYTARDYISSYLPDSRIKTSFNNGVNDTHEAIKLGNNAENATVHPMITAIHFATTTKITFGTIMWACALAGLRTRNENREKLMPKLKEFGGHLNANRLRYGFMTAATGAIISQLDGTWGNAIVNLPYLINYNVAALLAGDAGSWAWTKAKKKDFIEAIPFAKIQTNLDSFDTFAPIASPPSWKDHINMKNIGYGTAILATVDAAFFGGQGTAYTLGGVAAAVPGVPYIFIEDIPMHLPFAAVGGAGGLATGLTAGVGTALYLLGKKAFGRSSTPDNPDGPSV